ncbi:alcohol dehydrogenase [Rhizodiscina lignyota]|uniref:Alcohol dehydrogenase n=1 Tax=Rhizodiscina lignyota TaxID=1504668 RepID=A0A9P4I9I0_9PEZI|nr:alcohol dehydrogenase [Rhizodiscina lignyota]
MVIAARTSQWILSSQGSFDKLILEKDVPIPSVGPSEVLVKLYATSFNYRDIVMVKGSLGLIAKPNLIPLSDGAGVVLDVGPEVKEFRPGDRVITHMIPSTVFSADLASPDDEIVSLSHVQEGLGQAIDGTLRQYGVFHSSCLVHMPSNIDFSQASTLPCSALTAWNALFGLRGKSPGPGDWVLIQGSGGVSVAAMQFALAAGAKVIATSSNPEKAERLRALGATEVFNYKSDKDWGAKAKKITPAGRGVDFVLDVGGPPTLAQSLKAVRLGGVIAIAGIIAGSETNDVPSIMDCMWNVCTLRGVVLGTRSQFREMVGFIEGKDIKLAYDEKKFVFEDAKEAFEYVEDQKHFAKAVVCISGEA